jgi:hypothetical protein
MGGGERSIYGRGVVHFTRASPSTSTRSAYQCVLGRWIDGMNEGTYSYYTHFSTLLVFV